MNYTEYMALMRQKPTAAPRSPLDKALDSIRNTAASVVGRMPFGGTPPAATGPPPTPPVTPQDEPPAKEQDLSWLPSQEDWSRTPEQQQMVDLVTQAGSIEDLARLLNPETPDPWYGPIIRAFDKYNRNLVQPIAGMVNLGLQRLVPGQTPIEYMWEQRGDYWKNKYGTWGALGELERGRIESYPGEKTVNTFLYDPLTYLGIGGVAKSIASKTGMKTAAQILAPIEKIEDVALKALGLPVELPVKLVGQGLKRFGNLTGKLTGQIPKTEIMMSQTFQPDNMRVIGSWLSQNPAGRYVLRKINASAVAESIPAKAAVIRAVMGDMGQTFNNVRMATFDAIDKATNLFKVGEDQIVENVAKKSDKATGALGDIFERPNLYELTTEQQLYIDHAHEVMDWGKRTMARENIPLNELLGDDEWEYFHRLVKGKEKGGKVLETSPSGVRVGAKQSFQKSRLHEEMLEGIENGVIYGKDASEYISTYIRGVYKAIADKRYAEMIKPLGRKTGPRPMIKELEDAIRKSMKGEIVDQDTLLKLDELYPDIAKRIPAARNVLYEAEKYIRRKQYTRTLKDGTVKTYPAREGVQKIPVREGDKLLKEVKGLKQYSGIGDAVIDHPAFQGYLFPEEVANEVSRVLGDKSYDFLKKAETVSGALRLFQANADFSAPFIQGLAVLGKDPATWVKSVGHMFRVFVNPKVHAKYLDEAADIAESFGRHGGILDRHEMVEAAIPLQRWISSKNVALGKFFAETQGRFAQSFSAFGDMSRIEMWKGLSATAKNINELRDIAAVVNKMTGVMSTKSLGIGTTQRQVEAAFMFFAPRYVRAGLALTTDMVRGGVKGSIARDALGHMAAGGAMFYTWAALKMGQEPDFDPRSSRFMTLKIGNQNLGVGGIATAIFRFMADVVASGVERPLNLVSMSRWDNPFLKFWAGRMAPLTSVARDFLWKEGEHAQTFIGEPIETPQDYARYIGGLVTPFAWESVIAREPENRANLMSFLMEELGMRTFPKSLWQRRNELRDEYAKDYNTDWTNLNNLQRIQLEKEHPDLAEITRRAEQEYLDKDMGEPAWRDYIEYTTEADKVKEVYLNQVRLINRYYTGKNYRDLLADAKDEYFAQLEGLKEAHTQMPQTADDWAKLNVKRHPFDVVLDEYYRTLDSKSYENEAGEFDYDGYFEDKTRILSKMPEWGRDYIKQYANRDKEDKQIQFEEDRDYIAEKYWSIEDNIYRMYGVKDIAGMLKDMENRNYVLAREMRKRYPMLIQADKIVEKLRQLARKSDPKLEQALLRWQYVRVPIR